MAKFAEAVRSLSLVVLNDKYLLRQTQARLLNILEPQTQTESNEATRFVPQHCLVATFLIIAK